MALDSLSKRKAFSWSVDIEFVQFVSWVGIIFFTFHLSDATFVLIIKSDCGEPSAKWVNYNRRRKQKIVQNIGGIAAHTGSKCCLAWCRHVSDKKTVSCRHPPRSLCSFQHWHPDYQKMMRATHHRRIASSSVRSATKRCRVFRH